ncbi:hypothetical protein [Streptosporangium subroseum]|uniref:hypothetical protein n=1 Tax=Streptosporangium subroseum TaxID=106412 RepID=UPI0015C592FC|nr:hypothetical protein [Streptosporangium subroseum]
MAALAVGLVVLTGCGETPSQHGERLRKAAGVTAFRITCTKDIWERTKESIRGVLLKALDVDASDLRTGARQAR